MTPIVTYVFLDLGTTGKNAREDNITELCMIAVKREHLLAGNGNIPRVQSKLTLCFNPHKKISYEARPDGTGGFTDKDLENEPTFSMCFDTIKNFLYALEKPACLVAHNGYNFDYIILKRYLSNVTYRFFDMECVDNLHIFYKLERELKEGLSAENTLAAKAENECTPRKRPRGGGNYPWGSIENKPSDDGNYKLPTLYRRIMGHSPADAHKAEVDCKLMVEMAVRHGDLIVALVDKEQCKFSSL